MTETSWHEWQDLVGLPHSPVRDASPADIERAFWDLFWILPRCDLVARASVAVAHVYYDTCVLQGRGFAPRMLQRSSRVSQVDGRIGPFTMSRIRLLLLERNGELQLITRMLWLRRQRLLWTVQSRPTDRKFLKGWLNRLIRLRHWLHLPPMEWEVHDVETYQCERWD